MKKQQKSPWKALATALLMGGAGALLGFYGITLIKSYLPLQWFAPQNTGEKIGLVALGFFAVWFSIAIHELGHLGAGLAQGFRMALYTAGVLGVRGKERGVRFFFNRQVSLMGGVAATFPEHLESGPELRRKFVRIVAAGPLSSLLLSAVALLALYFILQRPADTPSLAARFSVFFLLITGLVSGVIFLATMIPSSGGGFMSDGARLLSLLNGGEKSRYEEATLSIMALLGAGKLPGEYPVDLLERLMTRSPDSLLGLNGHFVAFTHYFDRGDTERALPLAHLIQDHIAAAPPAFQAYYLKDVAFFHAFFAGDTEAARNCWEDIRKQAERDPDPGTFRVKAILALLDGQPEAAEDLVQKGLAKITELPFEGQRRFEEKWLRIVLEKVGRQQTAVH